VQDIDRTATAPPLDLAPCGRSNGPAARSGGKPPLRAAPVGRGLPPLFRPSRRLLNQSVAISCYTARNQRRCVRWRNTFADGRRRMGHGTWPATVVPPEMAADTAISGRVPASLRDFVHDW